MAKFKKPALILVMAALCLIIIALLGEIIFNRVYQFPKNLSYGVTFSPQYAKYLGLDWKKTYLEALSELKVRKLRLPSYWEEIEAVPGSLNFEAEDFTIDNAKKAGAKVILVVGAVQPRWPECHVPAWVKVLDLKQRRSKTLQFIKQVVERYQDNQALEAIQVENEPFLTYFGENCDRGDRDFLKAEVELVRGLTKKPVIVTDSGELGLWLVPMQISDIFGTTLYRDVYNPVMGNFSYPVLPFMYQIKSRIMRNFAPRNQKTIIAELQAEPWLGSEDLRKNPKRQADFFPVKKLQDIVDYAKKTGFDTQYLWGVEWWFWMAKNGHPEYLEFAKNLFR